MAKFSFVVSNKAIRVFNQIRWLDVDGSKGWVRSSGENLHLEVSLDDKTNAWRVITELITHMVNTLNIEDYNISEDEHGILILMYSLTKRRRFLMKEYKINNTWGIRCYNRSYDNACVLEVFMIEVPWEEVVDSAVFSNKDEANKKFKEFVAEYKDKEAFS